MNSNQLSVQESTLLMSLQTFNLWPRKSPNAITVSLLDLASQLSSLQVFTYPSERHYGSISHDGCSLTDMKDSIANILTRIPSPVLESHRQHMQKRK